MTPTGKLLFATTLGRTIYGRWQFHRMLSVVVTVAMLAVITAVMMGALVMGGFYMIYLYLISQAVAPLVAVFATGAIAILTIGLLVVAIRTRVRTLKASVKTPLSEAVDGFLDGLLAEK
jgi:hypothetical protein